MRESKVSTFSNFPQMEKVFPPSTPFAENTIRRNMAYSGGAHIVMTDYPVPPFSGRIH